MDSALYRAPGLALAPARSTVTLDRQRHQARVTWQDQRDRLPVVPRDASREEHLSEARMQEVWDREGEHVQAAAPLEERSRPLAVVAHRHAWVGTALSGALVRSGWEAVDVFGDAAAAVAALITYQPDVLVCSDRLLGGDGLSVLSRADALAPGTRLVVQLDEDSRLERVRAAGAHLVVSHRTPTATVAGMVLGLASGSDSLTSV